MSTLPKTGDSFIDTYAPDAIQSQKQIGVPASFTLAQALIESGRGKSSLTLKALNFFGIKGEGPAGHVVMNTREEDADGQSFFIDAVFAKFNTAAECFVLHGRIFLKPRYAPAMAVKNDARAFTRQVQACGYATAHNYADILIGVIDKYDLTRFDKIAGSQAGAAPQTSARPILKLQSAGQAVRDLQNALVKLGHLKANQVDGEFGLITEAAVKAFQKSKNLTADGICGADTWKALGV